MTMPEGRNGPNGRSNGANHQRAMRLCPLERWLRQSRAPSKGLRVRSTLVPSVIVGLVVTAVAGLSIWYLVRPQPLLVQGEVDARRFDLAARLMGAWRKIPSSAAKTSKPAPYWSRSDNPETIAKNEQALAAKVVAEAQLANINAGTRAEVIAARKAALERAEASVVLAQKNYRSYEPAGRERECASGAARSD